MRIIVAHARLNTFGGGERVTLELLRGLSANHTVTLWAGAYRPHHTYPALAAYPRRDLSPLQWLSATPPADAIIISQTFGSNLLALRHPATLLYLHTLRSAYFTGSRPDLLVRRHLDQRAAQHAAHLLTNSYYTAQRAMRHYHRHIEVIPPGVDPHYLTLPLQTAPPDPTHTGQLLYVGRLAPEKGIERLLHWTAHLPITLTLVGDGPPAYLAHLRRLAATAPTAQTTFRGPLDGAHLLAAYAACDIVVFTPHAEEFGLAALEAMAAAKPILAVRDGALPSLIADGHTGLLATDGHQFAQIARHLLADFPLRQRLGQAARAQARAYTWQRFITQIEHACALAQTQLPTASPP